MDAGSRKNWAANVAFRVADLSDPERKSASRSAHGGEGPSGWRSGAADERPPKIKISYQNRVAA
jgi:hypothetical protein